MVNLKEFEENIRAGKIARECLLYGKSLIKEGQSVLSILEKIEERILKSGGGIAFPAQMSLNNMAAHFCPTKLNDMILGKDVIKLDIGVHINGKIADNALTVDLSKQNSDLLKASEEAVKNAIKLARPGMQLREIGKTIQETIESHGFNPIKNLSGHGLGLYEIHTHPTIPNYDNGDEEELEEGMTIAIEPFASRGQGHIDERGSAGVFTVSKVPVRLPLAREIISQYENGLPFARHWLERKYSVNQTALALKLLETSGALTPYGPLVDDGLVSQFENSIIVADKPIVFTKSDEE